MSSQSKRENNVLDQAGVWEHLHTLKLHTRSVVVVQLRVEGNDFNGFRIKQRVTKDAGEVVIATADGVSNDFATPTVRILEVYGGNPAQLGDGETFDFTIDTMNVSELTFEARASTGGTTSASLFAGI